MNTMQVTRANELFDALHGGVTFVAVCGCGARAEVRRTDRAAHWLTDAEVAAKHFPDWIVSAKGSGVKNMCPKCVAAHGALSRQDAAVVTPRGAEGGAEG